MFTPKVEETGSLAIRSPRKQIGLVMSKAVPWSIKGVDFDAREAAKEAARRSGMSLGEWLNSVIADQAAELGMHEDEFDIDDRMDAVTMRLQRMREKQDDGRRRTPERVVRRVFGREDRAPAFDPAEFVGPAQLRRRIRDQFPAREPSYREPASEAELLLDRAVDAFDLRATQAQERTERALAGVTRRLAEIEGQVARRPQDDMRPLRDPIARLEDKVATILDTLSRGASSPAAAPLREPAHAPAGPSSRDVHSAIADIARRQRDLDGDAPPRRSLRDSLLSRAAAAPAAQADRAIETLQGDIAGLAARLEDMRREAQKTPSQTDIERLRRDISDLSRGLRDLAPRGSMVALEGAVHDLSQRLAASRSEGVREHLLAPIEAIAADLRQALREIDPRAHLDTLDHGIRAIARKLDTLPAPALDSSAFERLERQTGEIRTLVAEASARPLPLDKLERQVASLVDRLDQVSAAATPRATGDIEAAVQDIRDLLNRAQPGEALRAVEARLEKFAAKLDDTLRQSAPQSVDTANLERMMRAISEKIDAARTPENPQALERVMQSFTSKIEETLRQPQAVAVAADTSQLEEIVRGLADRVETLRPQQTDAKTLEAVMRTLADKIEAVRAPQGDGEALEALERQVAKLAERLDSPRPTDSAMASLERSIGDIFAHLEEMRNVTVDAAEAAARNAARETLRDVIERAPAPPSEEITRELAELRNRYDAADRRTHSTLNAVHETLEKVVDRIAMLEDEVADVRPQAQRPAAAREPASYEAAALDFQLSAPPPAAPAAYAQALHDDDFLIDPAQPAARAPEPRLPPVRPESPRAAPTPAAPANAAPASEPAKSAQANFIAAARRAAQAAVLDSQTPPAQKAQAGKTAKVVAKPAAASGGKLAQVRSAIEARRKPVVLGLTALVTLALAYQLLAPDDAPAPVAPQASAPARAPQPAPQASEPRRVETAPQGMAAPQAVAPDSPAAPATPSPSAAPGPGAQAPAANVAPRAAGPDMAPVGALHTAGAQNRPNEGAPQALRDLAAAGNAGAQFELGSRLAEGRGMTRDLKAAAHWFEKAAAQGLAPAQYRLGSLYEKGMGVSRDAALARTWYLRAAEQGNARAMHNLAVLTAEGVDGKPDYVAAAQWFRRGAEVGVRDSQFNLAILYARGLGVPQSMVHSYAWFAAAAAQGDADAGKKRDEVASRLSNSELETAKGVAAAFKARTPNTAANEAPVPAGGWEALQRAPEQTPGASSSLTRRPAKVSFL